MNITRSENIRDHEVNCRSSRSRYSVDKRKNLGRSHKIRPVAKYMKVCASKEVEYEPFSERKSMTWAESISENGVILITYSKKVLWNKHEQGGKNMCQAEVVAPPESEHSYESNNESSHDKEVEA